jgi:hypothetical protein
VIVAGGKPEEGIDGVADFLGDFYELPGIAVGLSADLVTEGDDVGIDAREEAGVIWGELDKGGVE